MVAGPSGQGLHDYVTTEIGRRIVRGEYHPDSSLPIEGRLVTEFGVSRATLREALRTLRGKGLIETVTRRGSRVRPEHEWHLLDPQVLGWRYESPARNQDLDDLMQVRLILEPAAARLAAKTRSPQMVASMHMALDKMRASVRDTEAFIEADLEFHAAIFLATGNSILIHVNSMMGVAMAAHRHLHTRSQRRHRATMSEHREVLRAIEERQPRQAEKALRELIEAAQRDVLHYTGRATQSGARRSGP